MAGFAFANRNAADNCPNDCGIFFNAQIVVVFWAVETQVFVPEMTNHRIWSSYSPDDFLGPTLKILPRIPFSSRAHLPAGY